MYVISDLIMHYSVKCYSDCSKWLKVIPLSIPFTYFNVLITSIYDTYFLILFGHRLRSWASLLSVSLQLLVSSYSLTCLIC